MTKYKMDAMMIQETHLKGTGVTKVKAHSSEIYVLYHTGTLKDSNHSVGIMVKENIELDFEVVSENICIGRAKLDGKTKREHVIICAYSPTLPVSEKHPEIRIEFYDNLENTIMGNGKKRSERCVK